MARRRGGLGWSSSRRSPWGGALLLACAWLAPWLAATQRVGVKGSALILLCLFGLLLFLATARLLGATSVASLRDAFHQD